jgi:hypothetical protein
MNGRSVLVAAVWMAAAVAARAGSDPFVKPTAEELSMTSVPGYPGAPAVVLFYEEISKDDLSVVQRYERIKVLTEDGKKYANVQLNFVRTADTGRFFDRSDSNEMTVGDIVGRTIHPDGTIIPFTGKPYLKTMEQTEGAKYQAKVFTLPDVEVGSIIEYRYTHRYNDHQAISPSWFIQGDLFVKQAHYVWWPTVKQLIDYKSRPINSISWFPILPAGAKIDSKRIPSGNGFSGDQLTYELNVKDVPPIVKEEYMPPLATYSYRVLFNFTVYRSSDDYWQSEGKEWSKRSDSFMKESGAVSAATQAAIAGTASSEEKLRKIYAKVMTLENTQFTRERSRAEGGLVSNVSDVLQQGRGSSTQLTELFIAMARAAGFKSYLMLVPNSSESLFTPAWLSFQQFDDTIAVVNVDGKDVYLDPGWRYTPYGHLAWEHMFVEGLRQVDGGTAFAKVSGEGYAANRTTRVANLTMDEHGQITGKIDLTYTGAEATRWRHRALSGDAESLNNSLRKSMENMVPSSLEVKVDAIKNLEDYEKPLAVSYEVNGTLGAATGKRLLMPADLFEARARKRFSQDKRETPVDFQYPESVADALRVNFQHGFEVEATPIGDKYMMEKRALYQLSVESGPTSFTTRRNFVMGDFMFKPEEYGTLRTFYSQLETKDKENVVLKVVPASAGSSGSGGRDD